MAGEQVARARLVPRSMCPKAGRPKDNGTTYARTTRLRVPLLPSSKSWAFWEMTTPSWQCKQRGAQQGLTPSSLRTHGQSGLRCEIGRAPQEAVERLLTLQDPRQHLGDLGCRCRPKPQCHLVLQQSQHRTQHHQDYQISTQLLHQGTPSGAQMCRPFSEQQLRC